MCGFERGSRVRLILRYVTATAATAAATTTSIATTAQQRRSDRVVGTNWRTKGNLSSVRGRWPPERDRVQGVRANHHQYLATLNIQHRLHLYSERFSAENFLWNFQQYVGSVQSYVTGERKRSTCARKLPRCNSVRQSRTSNLSRSHNKLAKERQHRRHTRRCEIVLRRFSKNYPFITDSERDTIETRNRMRPRRAT